MRERLVVIGGDAAGMSAASQAKRLRGDELEIVGVRARGNSPPTRRAASRTGWAATSQDGTS